MKNCPRCGTVIIDNKNVCDNCGADLTEFNKTELITDDGFADNFFAQIGGVVSGEQGNVIENQEMDVKNIELTNKKNIQQHNVHFVDSNKTNENGESFNSILSNYISSGEEGSQPEVKTEKNKLFTIEKANKKEDKAKEVAQPMTQNENLPQVTMAYDSQIPKRVEVDPVKIEPIPYQPPVIKDDDEYVPPLHVTQRQPIVQQPVQVVVQQVDGQTTQQIQVVQQPQKKFNASIIVNLLGILVFLGAIIFVILC